MQWVGDHPVPGGLSLTPATPNPTVPPNPHGTVHRGDQEHL